MTNDTIENLKIKIRKATSQDSPIQEFERALNESTDPPIMVALDIVEKYNGNIWELFDALPISSVSKDFSGNVVGRLYNVNSKEYERNGKRHKLISAIIRDNTGSVPITIFDPPYLNDGDLVLIRSIISEEFNGRIRLKSGRFSEIEVLKRGSLPALSKISISQINPEMKFIEVEGDLQIIEKNRPIKGDQSKMTYGILKDSTGTIALRAWDVDIEEGLVRISGAYPKVYNGKLYLNINKNSKVELLRKKSQPKNIYELNQAGNGELESIGMIVSFITKNPFIDVCSECGRILRNNRCDLHPDAKPMKIVRLTATLDDGSSSHYVYLYQRNIVDLIGEEPVKSSLANLDISYIKDKLNDLVLSNFKFKLTAYISKSGSSTSGSRSIMEFEEISRLTEEDIKALLEKLKGDLS